LARWRWESRSPAVATGRADVAAYAAAEQQIATLDAQRGVDAPQVAAAVPDAGCPFSRAPSRTISRRGLLAGAASIAAVPLLGRASPAGAVLPLLPPTVSTALGAELPGVAKWVHGKHLRGARAPAVLGPFAEARFGRVFKALPDFDPDRVLIKMAGAIAETRDPQRDIPTENLDNPNMPSGSICLGQFIDHDMTHDTTPLGQQQVDPLATTNFESPQFDLSSVYGRGPLLDPQL